MAYSTQLKFIMCSGCHYSSVKDTAKCVEEKKKQQLRTENQSNFGLVGLMSVISRHAVLHTGVILTKRVHIVLTPMLRSFPGGQQPHLETEGQVKLLTG